MGPDDINYQPLEEKATNVITLNGEPVYPQQEHEATVRALEKMLQRARDGQFVAVSITALMPGNIPYDYLAVEPMDVLALAGAVGITLKRIRESVVYEEK
jgi:hypothetical protein